MEAGGETRPPPPCTQTSLGCTEPIGALRGTFPKTRHALGAQTPERRQVSVLNAGTLGPRRARAWAAGPLASA